jgi:NHL repeat
LSLVLAISPARAQQYWISTFAGSTPAPTSAIALNTAIGDPISLASDAAGRVYFIDRNTVLKVDAAGILTRVAGNARAGHSGDGGPAVDAQINEPLGLAVDSAGSVYIADSRNNRIRKVTPDGTIRYFNRRGAPHKSSFPPILAEKRIQSIQKRRQDPTKSFSYSRGLDTRVSF